MKKEELRNDIVVGRVKHGRIYKVVSANCWYKDSIKGWVDAVCYQPLYDNKHEMFMRSLESFLTEFETVEV